MMSEGRSVKDGTEATHDEFDDRDRLSLADTVTSVDGLILDGEAMRARKTSGSGSEALRRRMETGKTYFHQRSIMKTWLAAVRLMPTPPALTLSTGRSTNAVRQRTSQVEVKTQGNAQKMTGSLLG